MSNTVHHRDRNALLPSTATLPKQTSSTERSVKRHNRVQASSICSVSKPRSPTLPTLPQDRLLCTHTNIKTYTFARAAAHVHSTPQTHSRPCIPATVTDSHNKYRYIHNIDNQHERSPQNAARLTQPHTTPFAPSRCCAYIEAIEKNPTQTAVSSIHTSIKPPQ